jgi:hypothetical protein
MSIASWTKNFFSYTTARTTGWVDMFKTIGALLVLAAAITGLAWASGFVAMSLASALTLYVATMLVISAIATFNYIFAAQFTRASLSAFPVGDQKYGKEGKEVGIQAIVQTLISVANKKNPKNPKLQLPTNLWVGMFNDDHVIKMTSVYGINKKAAAIFIPSGILMAHHRKLSEKELAALLMVEVIKIRNSHARRGFFHAIGNIGLTFASLIEDLDHSSWFLGRLIATIGSPFQLVLLFQKSRNRTYHYEAITNLVDECGVELGQALKTAYIKLGLPWQNPNLSVITDVPYTAEGTLDNAYDGAAQTVFTVLKGNKEIFSDAPSAGNVQKYLEEILNSTKTPRATGTPALHPDLVTFFNNAAPTPTSPPAVVASITEARPETIAAVLASSPAAITNIAPTTSSALDQTKSAANDQLSALSTPTMSSVKKK